MKTKLKSFVSKQFIGKPLLVDVEFLDSIKKLNQFAKTNQLKIYVTSAVRQQGLSVKGAIVPPASRSNHLIGHAIDMNIKFKGDFFNSKALKKSNFDNLPSNIQSFINAIRNDSVLRWGGDFNTPDPVHIDDALNMKSPTAWNKKFTKIQSELIALTTPQPVPNQPRFLFLTRPLMQGTDVHAVQQKLIDKGVNMNADSFFGSITDRAVTLFQEEAGLTPDGIVGPDVLRALDL